LLEYEERAVLLATNTTAFAAVKKATLGARRADKDLWDVKRYATRLVRAPHPSASNSAGTSARGGGECVWSRELRGGCVRKRVRVRGFQR
jgi:hypothetical protein